MAAVKLLETHRRRDLLHRRRRRAVPAARGMPRSAGPAARAALRAARMAVLHGAWRSSATTADASAAARRSRSPARASRSRCRWRCCSSCCFPRVSGAFWSLPPTDRAVDRPQRHDEPRQHHRADGIRRARVPRARFIGKAPPREELLLARTGAARFRRLHVARPARPQLDPHPAAVSSARRTAITITLEPHSRNWWFALDTVVAVAASARAAHLRPSAPLGAAGHEVTQYEAVSYTRTQIRRARSR